MVGSQGTGTHHQQTATGLTSSWGGYPCKLVWWSVRAWICSDLCLFWALVALCVFASLWWHQTNGQWSNMLHIREDKPKLMLHCRTKLQPGKRFKAGASGCIMSLHSFVHSFLLVPALLTPLFIHLSNISTLDDLFVRPESQFSPGNAVLLWQSVYQPFCASGAST